MNDIFRFYTAILETVESSVLKYVRNMDDYLGIDYLNIHRKSIRRDKT